MGTEATKHKYISEEINKNEIKSWHTNDIITIEANTGAGKTYFIMNKLYDYAATNNKKILLLVSRSPAKLDFESEAVGKSDHIEIMTYQRIENGINKNNPTLPVSLSDYDVICCDEAHYFLTDTFNKWRDLSFDKILESNSIKLYISATLDSLMRYFNEMHDIHPKRYIFESDSKNIRKLNFFRENESLDGFMQKAIENNQKAMFFINNTQRAYELHNRYPEYTLFNCSEQSNYYKYVNKKKVHRMYKENKFDELILIATSVMDTGISIKDSSLHKVVIDSFYDYDIIQFLGRKRMMDNQDYVDVYIKNQNGYVIRTKRDENEKWRKKLGNISWNGEKFFVEEHYREDIPSELLHFEWDKGENKMIAQVPSLTMFKLEIDPEMLEQITNKKYCKYVSDKLGIKEYGWVENNPTRKRQNVIIDEYLESFKGEKLLVDDQEKLKHIIMENGFKKNSIGLKTINDFLKSRKIDYKLESGRTSKRENGKVKSYRYWKII